MIKANIAYWLRAVVAMAATATVYVPVSAQLSSVCEFRQETLSFRGSPSEQAECLMRHVSRWGKVSGTHASLDLPLKNLIGAPTGQLKEQLKNYLLKSGLSEAALGGELANNLSHAMGGKESAPVARYFVIHDTSAPYLGNATGFPANDSTALNKLTQYAGPKSVAHVFVNRIGATLVGHDFSQPWRATKFENQAIGLPAKGLFLHIELVQPRRRDPAGGPKNDALAPDPGFTQAQYEKLALLYAMASARKGEWLIPAFHAVLDAGLADAHDDPQNFDLGAFGSALQALLTELTGQKNEATQTDNGQPPSLASLATVDGATDRLKACASIVASLRTLPSGTPLIAQGAGGRTWKSLFDECDTKNTFGGRTLTPVHNGKSPKCSTDPNRVDYLNQYKDGTVVFSAKAAVDADGSPVIGGSGWPNNVQTWLTYDLGSVDKYVNSEEVPFIVMPGASTPPQMALMKEAGIGRGDLSVAIRGDKCTFGVVGDSGPWFRLGELSMRAHEELGNPQCKVAGQHPCQALKGGSGIGISSGVTYLVFPGSRPKPLHSQSIYAVSERGAIEKALAFFARSGNP